MERKAVKVTRYEFTQEEIKKALNIKGKITYTTKTYEDTIKITTEE